MIQVPEQVSSENENDRFDNDADFFEALINGDESISPDDPIHFELSQGISGDSSNGPLMSLEEAIASLSPELREVLDDRLRADFREVRPFQRNKQD